MSCVPAVSLAKVAQFLTAIDTRRDRPLLSLPCWLESWLRRLIAGLHFVALLWGRAPFKYVLDGEGSFCGTVEVKRLQKPLGRRVPLGGTEPEGDGNDPSFGGFAPIIRVANSDYFFGGK